MLAANIEDYRLRARRRLPRMFFDYLDGGSFGEVTLRRNRADFDSIIIGQRILRDVAVRDHGATFLGQDWSAPLILAPLGFCGLFRYRGEIKAARAAQAAGIPFSLSTMSIAGLSDVAGAVRDKPIFQSYVFRDRDLSLAMLEVAGRLGAPTLVLTVDANVSGVRERDTRNGFRTATRLGPRALFDLARHLPWCLGMAPGRMPQLGNVADRHEYGHGVMAQASRLSAQIDPSLTWKDVAWLRQRWNGRLVVKGIMSPEDAVAAVEAGADAIVVSNHGGRQLDGAASTIAVLPSVVRVLGRRAEIFIDSGIRRGTDVFKALALGADAVLLGRAYAYGLAADGERGVAGAIALIRAELDIAMALCGVHSLAELRADGSNLLKHAFDP